MENIELETQGEYSSEDNNTSLDDVQQPNKSVNSVCTVNKNKVRKKYEYIFRRGAKSKMRLEHKGNNSHFKFTSYSNIEGIKCTVGNHNPIIDSQYILSSNIYGKLIFDLLCNSLTNYEKEFKIRNDFTNPYREANKSKLPYEYFLMKELYERLADTLDIPKYSR